jgi:hypothetical protein
MTMRNSAKALYCMQAFRYVKLHVQDEFGASNVGDRNSDFLDEGQTIKSGQYLRSLRQYVTDQKPTGVQQIVVRAQAAKLFGAGNCMEQACMAMNFLHDKGVPCTLVSVTMPDSTDNHVFVITSEIANATDLADCGATPVCDPWVHEKAVAESAHGFGSGVSTSVKHAAVLKALGFGTKMSRMMYWEGKVIDTGTSATASSSIASPSTASATI